jgi:hypothetical protein
MRTVIVGDVHGCSEELDALLDKIAFTSKDRLVFVGDLIVRGPDSVGVLAIVRRTDAVVVRGNHEDKILRWRAAKLRHARGLGDRPDPLRREHAKVARALSKRDWTLLAKTPYFFDLPEHGARIVHAGVVPGVPFDEQRPQTMTRIRGVSARGEWLEKGASVLWGELYKGPPHIVFGHNAMEAPQLHPWATGIDTACVYGGKLTAMVLEDGEKIPRGAAARALLVSQPARRAYSPHKVLKQKRVA